MSALALVTTLYPGVERFLPAWTDSVLAQEDKDFEVWAGLDGIAARVLEPLSGRVPVHTVDGGAGATPASVRQAVMERAVTRHPGIVFVDADDVLHPSRVSSARGALSRADVSGCSLRIVDEEGVPVGAEFRPPKGASWDDLLPRYNVFGLSNSAWASETLAASLPIPRDCILTDWLLATRAWSRGARLAFDPEPRMDYRQYAANTARVLPPFSAADVTTAARLLVAHYALVLGGDGDGMPGAPRARIQSAASRANRFRDAIARPEVLAAYVSALNALPPLYVWWWCVAHPELEHIWNT